MKLFSRKMVLSLVWYFLLAGVLFVPAIFLSAISVADGSRELSNSFPIVFIAFFTSFVSLIFDRNIKLTLFIFFILIVVSFILFFTYI